MLHFVTGVYNTLFSTPEYHVLIVGRECAGKSTLLEQLKFLYTPATQQREEEQRLAERRAAQLPPVQQQQQPSSSSSAPAPHSEAEASFSSTVSSSGAVEPSETALAGHHHRRPSLPPGTPLRATAAYMAQKRIRPTVGLNYAVVQHRFSPPVAVVQRKKKAELHATAPVASLPPPPQEVLAEQRARQQALLANAPSDAVTRVVLRDLGGQTALRELWEKYYEQTQALVYVVDSTLPFRSPATTTAAGGPSTAAPPPRDHFTKRELEELYQPDRQLLARLLQHPLLEGVPVLLLSNKVDETPHMPLASVQEAMRLADLAADRAFYVRDHVEDKASSSGTPRGDSSTSPSTAAASAKPAAGSATAVADSSAPALARHSAGPETTQRRVGESGFGEIALRIVEVSAMDGAGVAGAMDWLVAQLLHRARNVNSEA